jgi:hypothetical protein
MSPENIPGDATADTDWLRLDNAAKIFPSGSTKEAPAVFRLSVTFEQPIRIATLQQAFAALLSRCPYYQVYLRRGVFWYYLQRHNQIPSIELLQEPQLFEMPIHKKNTPLLQLRVRATTMALDFSHILTDVLGGMRFLTSLVWEYLRLRGIDVELWDGQLNPSDDPHPEKYEDAHKRHFESGQPKPPRLSDAYQLPGNTGCINTLKTKGYHFEHNFGYGERHLSETLLSLNIIAFLFHTVLELLDQQCTTLRKALARRDTFFQHFSALLHCSCFALNQETISIPNDNQWTKDKMRIATYNNNLLT